MPTPVFLRTLFGDTRIDNFQSVLDEVRWCLAQPHQPSPTLWYAFGRQNADYLRSCGVTPILMDPEPFSRFGSDAPERAHYHATIRFNSSCWRHRYVCIEHALQTHPACVQLDLDTVLADPLPADFWDRMAKGAVFQATLQQNKRKRAGWRTEQMWLGKGPVDDDTRKTPAGAFTYWRGQEAVRIALDLYAKRPFEWDLHILARLTEILMGGTWQGWRRYKELGFEPYCHTLGKHESRQCYRPDRRLFVTHWRKPRLRGYPTKDLPYMLACEFPEQP